MNVKDRQLSSLNVQFDLFSVVKVLTHDEYATNNAEGFNQGARPDSGDSMGRGPWWAIALPNFCLPPPPWPTQFVS